MNVFVFAETEAHSLEILGEAKRIVDLPGGNITCFVDNTDSPIDSQVLFHHGANRVLILPVRPKEIGFDGYFNIILNQVSIDKPDLLLFGSTCRICDIIFRLAAELDLLCITETQTLTYDDKKEAFEVSEMIYGGLATRKQWVKKPALIGTSLGTFSQGLPQEQTADSICINIQEPVVSNIVVEDVKQRNLNQGTLKNARVVVGFGRGVEKEDITILNHLCTVLNAEIACTRPIADECKWLPEERYIGVTGQSIKPDLYFGIGVSGQVQHMVGVKDAKVIVAINNNQSAPIFERADYGIVADYKELVPVLIDYLKNK